ncbi:MAG: hypothetical protein ACI971_002134 [Colwellia sp.]|jgi:hypothetical protein
MNTLRLAYVNSDDLYVWVNENFDSFDKWLVFEAKNIELLNTWEQERTFRIIEGAKSGLITEVLKGNASAVGQLKSLLGLNRSVGRPKGTCSQDEEYQFALEKRLQGEYKADAARLSSI